MNKGCFVGCENYGRQNCSRQVMVDKNIIKLLLINWIKGYLIGY